MDERISDYKVVETPAGLCYQKPQPPKVEYAVAIADSFPTQYRFTYLTLAEAAQRANLGNYVVVVEDGAMRGLNAEEQAEVEKYRSA